MLITPNVNLGVLPGVMRDAIISIAKEINITVEEKNISILVLGAATGSKGPGPLVSELTKKNAGEINIPITIVPGNLSYKKIQDIS